MIISTEKIRRLYEENKDNGAFELHSTETAIKAFMENHFPEAKGYSEVENTVLADIFDIIEQERKNAFAKGCHAIAKLV